MASSSWQQEPSSNASTPRVKVELFDCPICLERIEDPRILPCGHSLCGAKSLNKCLAKLERRGKEGNVEIECPNCRKVHQVRAGNVPPPYGFTDILEKVNKVKLCDEHEEEIQYFCHNDRKEFCGVCWKKNHKGHDVELLGVPLCRELSPFWEKRQPKLTMSTSANLEEKVETVCAYLDNLMRQYEEEHNEVKLEETLRVLVRVQTESVKGVFLITECLHRLIVEKRKLAIDLYIREIAAEKPEDYEQMMRIPEKPLLEILKRLSFGTESRLVKMTASCGGTMISVGLSVAKVTWDVFVNMRKWFKGEISGTRCTAEILKSGGTAAGAVGGATGGAMLGLAICGPMGAFIGATVGSIVAGVGTNQLMKDMLYSIFDLPKTTAEENAYNFFGVHHEASIADLNKAYHKMCLKHHPDKSGNRAMWDKTQIQFQIIRFARGVDK